MPARRAYIAAPQFLDHEIEDSAIREHNARVVGYTPILPARPVRALPGVIHTLDAPFSYKPISFGAHREWNNDDEGWETQKTRRSRRRWLGRNKAPNQ
jgi:hypothetical protein